MVREAGGSDPPVPPPHTSLLVILFILKLYAQRNVFEYGSELSLYRCRRPISFIMWNNTSRLLAVDRITCFLRYQSMTVADIETLTEVSIATSIVNSLTMILALVANGLVIVAVWTSRALHSPSNILVSCLAVTDLLTGLITQPLFILSHIARIKGLRDFYCYTTLGFSISVAISSITSFLLFSVVSVNRFLVLHLHLRYKELVTNRRVIFVVVCCWIMCIVEASFTITYGFYEIHFEILVMILTIGVAVTVTAYMKIFFVIRKYEKKSHVEQKLLLRLCENAEKGGKITSNDFIKQWKVSRTMAFISALFLLCYIPYIGVLVANVVYIKQITSRVSLKIAGNVTLTIVLGNSAANPFLYLHRMRDIRKAVLHLLQKWRMVKRYSRTERSLFTERKETVPKSFKIEKITAKV